MSGCTRAVKGWLMEGDAWGTVRGGCKTSKFCDKMAG